MQRRFATGADSLETIVYGARIMAAGDQADADTMEHIIRKAARIAREAIMMDAKAFVANDEGSKSCF